MSDSGFSTCTLTFDGKELSGPADHMYRLLRDEQLWQALAAAGLNRPVSNPISDFSGKPGRAS